MNLCKSMCLYTIKICTDGMAIGTDLCALLASSGVVYYWMNAYYNVHVLCIHADTVHIWMYLYPCICNTIYLHPPYYNIAR